MKTFAFSLFGQSDSFRDLFMQFYWAETVMFVKKWKLIFSQIGRMNWGAGHLIIIEGTGGWAFANKDCPRGRAFDQFFKCPGFAWGLAPPVKDIPCTS